MSQFGELVLVIGDFHLPMRAVDIPDKFKELLVPGKIQHVICTGNIGNRETTDWLRSICGETHLVRGDFDSMDLPGSKDITLGEWKIHVTHGHTITPWDDTAALMDYQRVNDCDILITGHTHKNYVEQVNGKVFMNPGSVTGAQSTLTQEVTPSFLLMAIQDKEITVFIYELVEGNVTVNKVQASK